MIVSQESLELSSISKLVGHPDIQTLDGIDKLRNRTFQHNPIDHQEICDLISSAKKNFIYNYYLKKKKWPLVKFSKNCNPTLLYCSLNNLLIHHISIPQHLSKITLRDFSQIQLEKVEEFDHLLSQFDYLKDTALAETRSILNSPTWKRVKDEQTKRTSSYFFI